MAIMSIWQLWLSSVVRMIVLGVSVCCENCLVATDPIWTWVLYFKPLTNEVVNEESSVIRSCSSETRPQHFLQLGGGKTQDLHCFWL